MSFWDDLLFEKRREDRREPDAGNLDDSLSQRDKDVYGDPAAAQERGSDDKPG